MQLPHLQYQDQPAGALAAQSAVHLKEVLLLHAELCSLGFVTHLDLDLMQLLDTFDWMKMMLKAERTK